MPYAPSHRVYDRPPVAERSARPHGRTLGELHREGAAHEEALEAYAKALSVTERVRANARVRVGGMQQPSGTWGGLGDGPASVSRRGWRSERGRGG